MKQSEFIGMIELAGYSPASLNVTTVTFLVQGKRRAYVIYGQNLMAEQLVVFTATLPVFIPKNWKQEVFKYINYCNFSSAFGNMEFNFETSEVVFRTSGSYRETDFSLQLMYNLIQDSYGGLEAFGTGVELILSQKLGYQAAFEKGHNN